VIEVVPALAVVIGNLVYLGYEDAERTAGRHVILAVKEDAAFHLFSYLYRVQALFDFDGPGDETSSFDLDFHKLEHISLHDKEGTFSKLLQATSKL